MTSTPPPIAALAGFQPIVQIGRREQITTFLRQQLVSGALPAGSRLPSTQELAQQWGSPVATVHAALNILVKEGFLLRRPRVGTIVQPRAPLNRVAILRGADPHGGDRFARRLSTTLASHLEAMGIASAVFIDDRQEAERNGPGPELRRALNERTIDAIIAAETDATANQWLNALPFPYAYVSNQLQHNSVRFDLAQFASTGVAHLAGQGCRRIGLIHVGKPDDVLHRSFVDSLAQAGLACRDAWLRIPPSGVPVLEAEAEGFGFDSVRALMSSDERPDGLLIHTDVAARGALLGLMPCLADGSAAPRLVLHRNLGLNLLCPLPAAFLETSIDLAADALIDLVLRQRRGEATAGRLLQYNLVR